MNGKYYADPGNLCVTAAVYSSRQGHAAVAKSVNSCRHLRLDIEAAHAIIDRCCRLILEAAVHRPAG
jgi:hypothetical protein